MTLYTPRAKETHRSSTYGNTLLRLTPSSYSCEFKPTVGARSPASAFTCTADQPNHHVISPEWLSEARYNVPAFGTRRYRPWAFEFPGARYWQPPLTERAVTSSGARPPPAPVTSARCTSQCGEFPPLALSDTRPLWVRQGLTGGMWGDSGASAERRAWQSYSARPGPGGWQRLPDIRY